MKRRLTLSPGLEAERAYAMRPKPVGRPRGPTKVMLAVRLDPALVVTLHEVAKLNGTPLAGTVEALLHAGLEKIL